ncbi:translation initiation factor IF-2 N-terminal domain-containing protein, partial [Paenibacillus kobensis]|uniref:translation initiation factor IF-2 N-terminal domain-containing protein n=1 Tax=Paenibacillus kobensis TaxID=59841 RepID=UPI001580A7D4
MTKQPDSKDNNKDKLRVYEYAKSLNMSSKEIITILKRLNLPVNNHMSVMENNMVSKVEGFFSDIKQSAAVKRASETASVSAAATQRPQDNRKPAVSAEKPAAQQPSDSNKNHLQDRQGTMNSIKTTMNTSNQQQGEQQEQRSEQQEQRSAQQAPRQSNQGGQGGGGYRGQGGGQGGQGGG